MREARVALRVFPLWFPCDSGLTTGIPHPILRLNQSGTSRCLLPGLSRQPGCRTGIVPTSLLSHLLQNGLPASLSGGLFLSRNPPLSDKLWASLPTTLTTAGNSPPNLALNPESGSSESRKSLCFPFSSWSSLSLPEEHLLPNSFLTLQPCHRPAPSSKRWGG